MELELGLALPNHTSTMMIQGFDLNCSGNNGMEITEKNKVLKDYRKPGFLDDQLVDHHVEAEGNNGLSLLLWSGQPNDQEDDRRKPHVNINNENVEEENNDEMVGWPPINSLRIELLHRHQGGGSWIHNHQAPERATAVRNSTYVKVKMEGVAIGRKIDVRLYNSYEALRNSLIDMFAKYNRIDSTKGDNTILYQDKEGDWMLVGDVPWETFVETVQRMEILKERQIKSVGQVRGERCALQGRLTK